VSVFSQEITLQLIKFVSFKSSSSFGGGGGGGAIVEVSVMIEIVYNSTASQPHLLSMTFGELSAKKE